MNEELMLKCREEYALLPQEEQQKYLAQLSDAYGQEFVDAFTSFMETGNYPKFAEQVTTTPEFPAGELKEVPGMANGYERTMEEVAASLNTEHAPVYEAIMSMGNELNAAPPVKQAEMMDQLASARGQEFSEAVYFTFKHPDFCEYIAREAQSFFDTLAGNFAQSRDQVGSLSRIGNFSETLSKGVLSYATKGKPGNFSILESVALLSALARKDFSENGELADAIMELGEGEVSEKGAETVAENILENAVGEAAEVPDQIEEIAEKVDDTPAPQVDAVEEEKPATDMSQRRRKARRSFSEAEASINTTGQEQPTPTETAPVDDQTVVREKEQNNAMLDAVIEKYKALQTEEAKAQMVAEMQQLLAPELVEYIIARAEGEDFSEGTQEGEVEPKAVADGINPAASPAAEAESGDLDHYEELSKQLLGQYEESPIGKVVAAEAPQAVSTLPEGAPVAATEGGTTMAEDYEREPVIDKYEEMGLI